MWLLWYRKPIGASNVQQHPFFIHLRMSLNEYAMQHTCGEIFLSWFPQLTEEMNKYAIFTVYIIGHYLYANITSTSPQIQQKLFRLFAKVSIYFFIHVLYIFYTCVWQQNENWNCHRRTWEQIHNIASFLLLFRKTKNLYQ